MSMSLSTCKVQFDSMLETACSLCFEKSWKRWLGVRGRGMMMEGEEDAEKRMRERGWEL